MKTVVSTKHQLGNLVSRICEYTKHNIKFLSEAEDVAPQTTPPPAQQAAPAPTTPAATTPETPAEEETPLSSIIEQLNTIRGGHSFKDEAVKTELQRYWDGLEESEKDALHAYLKGIAQIVSGQVDAGSAEGPKTHGVETSSTGKKTRTIKPNIIRKATPKTEESAVASAVSTPSKENTAAPAPIVPKKR